MTRANILAVAATMLLAVFGVTRADAGFTPEDADVNQDGVVSAADMALVVAGVDARADVNGDGVVNIVDRAIVGAAIEAAQSGTPVPSPTATQTAVPGAVLPPLPAGWPSTLQLGSADTPGRASALKQVAPFGFRYQYLAGGANTGTGWSTWNPNGTFATNYIQDSVNNGIVPVFSYYMIAQSQPGAAQGEVDGVYNNLNNAATMAAYYNDLKLFLQRAGAFPDKMVVLHVEPDMWGFIQQRAANDDATTVSVKVASSGVTELSGIPNNARGLAQAIDRMRDLYAPNVVLGYHMSTWGTGNNPIYSNPSDVAIDSLATRSANFYLSLQSGFDIAFTDASDRDAAFKEFQYGDGGAARWDDGDFRRNVRWINKFVQLAQTRMIQWQIPLGNTKMRAQNNTWNHYQDNHAEWLLDEPEQTHLRDYINAGVVAFLFGRGANGATCACDANADGVTDPAPINGNVYPSLNADDDGGFFKQKTAWYYARGSIALPASGAVSTVVPTPTATRTVTSTPTRTAMATQTSIASAGTATPTRTATSTPQPGAPTATRTPSGTGSGCVTNCGTPRFFCDTGSWAFCDDYRDLYCPSLNFLNDCKFPDIDGVGRGVSVVTYSSSDPDYLPQVDAAFTPHGWFFNQQEHFHSQIIDGNFGVALARQHQPFDFAGREGHVRFEVDLKTSARRYVRLMLSPEITKSIVDDRAGVPRPDNALDIWFQNGAFQGHIYKNGTPICPGGCANAFSVDTPRYFGVDNVRDIVDVYVTRTHVRILVNGSTYVDTDTPDIGFDRAYVYLAQASYNPCKDGQCTDNLQIFHWDNLAYDGPALADNSLTPSGYQDVVFVAYGQASCTVNGVPAASNGDPSGYTWVSWVARMPIQAVSAGDVACVDGDGGYHWNTTGRTPFDFEVVKRP